MTLKNWRKMPGDYYWFRWRDDDRKKEIEVYQVRGNRKWFVSHTGTITSKSFKTKLKALAFAKAYMRKH